MTRDWNEYCGNCKYYDNGKCTLRKPIEVQKKDWCKEYVDDLRSKSE